MIGYLLLGVLGLVIIVPLVTYLCVKLGTVAYFRGRRIARKMEEEENRYENHNQESEGES